MDKVTSGRGNRPPRVRGGGGSNGPFQSPLTSVTRVYKTSVLQHVLDPLTSIIYYFITTYPLQYK